MKSISVSYFFLSDTFTRDDAMAAREGKGASGVDRDVKLQCLDIDIADVNTVNAFVLKRIVSHLREDVT